MGFTDKYIIVYSDSRECWTAINTQLGLHGTGKNPEDALEKGIQAVDLFIGLVNKKRCSETLKPVPELILELANIAEPLNGKDYIRGVVYKHERFIDEYELSIPAA